ncbi:MAG: hypothetical protein H8E59_12010 [Actinobacteria bacterium]|nr:hypothetical protein [Actinomycetota bacterium]
MVEFDLGGALVSGFVATVAMSSMMAMARMAGMTRMPAMPLVLGSMFTGDRQRAVQIGLLGHYLMMGTAAFGAIYALRYAALDIDTWSAGLAIGAIHGAVVGAVVLPMMGRIHPRLRIRSGRDTVTDEGGVLLITAPGFFGRAWGAMTPMGIVVGHALYGLVSVLVYTALA